jgi:hypothetical protein
VSLTYFTRSDAALRSTQGGKVAPGGQADHVTTNEFAGFSFAIAPNALVTNLYAGVDNHHRSRPADGLVRWLWLYCAECVTSSAAQTGSTAERHPRQARLRPGTRSSY